MTKDLQNWKEKPGTGNDWRGGGRAGSNLTAETLALRCDELALRAEQRASNPFNVADTTP